jgi:hypothetical protein
VGRFIFGAAPGTEKNPSPFGFACCPFATADRLGLLSSCHAVYLARVDYWTLQSAFKSENPEIEPLHSGSEKFKIKTFSYHS